MVGARNDDDVARLGRARVQHGTVIQRHDEIGFAVNHEMVGDTGRRGVVLMRRELHEERHAEPAPVVALVVRELMKVAGRVPGDDRVNPEVAEAGADAGTGAGTGTEAGIGTGAAGV